MMKRTGVPRLGPDEPAPLPPQNQAQIQQAGASNMHTLAQSAQPQILDIRSPAGPATLLSVGGSGSFARTGARPSGGGPVINYLKTSAVQYAAKQPPPPPQVPQRLKTLPPQQPNLGALPAALGRQSPAPAPLATPPGVAVGPGAQQQQAAGQFQRLKVEDALSYLDQVKYKFNTQPQVYNDFLDIMKEFKSQTIDTPGVITRVSNLFKGHPELIVGFNTFLPPGYKIEVQSNGQVLTVYLQNYHAFYPLRGEAEKEAVRRAGGPYSNMEMSVNNAIVHNLSVNAAPTNTLHQISQAHQQLEAAAIHHASGPGSAQPANPAHPAPAPPSQPVEFNHAIEYVNKIKSRFSRQPDKYKRFLEILHAYQRGHREMKEPQAKQQTEQEVYSQLFENQDDLLAEFGQFLPDAKAVTKPAPESRERHYPHVRSPPVPAHHQSSRVESEVERFPGGSASPPPPHAAHTLHAQHPHHLAHHHHAPQLPKHTGSTSSSVSAPPQQHHHLKRSPSFTSSSQMAVGAPPAKKSRLSGLTGATVRDVSYAEASKLATVHECLLLFTNEIISSSELLSVTAPFLCRHPELQKWLQDFLGPPSPPHTPTNTLHSSASYNSATFGSASNVVFERERPPAASDPKLRYEPIGPLGAQLRHDRPQGDAAMDIDLSTCKRLGTSYCALPREAAARRCSGRTALCREVLNDTWVSFPTWSEDSTFVTSRKTQYEEYIYRCEDERFELDVVIETNASTIRVLEGVQKKLARMTPEDAAKYRLDDCLGGHSPTIHQRALRRIYGDKVVRSSRTIRHAVQRRIGGFYTPRILSLPVFRAGLGIGFNKQWREQNEKYYLKSLDHQGINFKQNDLKAMRSKSLFNEVESAFAARRPGPHVVVDYNMQSRQEEEKDEAGSPGSPTTENPEDKNTNDSSESDNASDKSGKNNKNKENKPKNNNNTDSKESSIGSANSVKRTSSNEEMSMKTDIKSEPQDVEEDYRDHPPNEARFVCTSSWYLFLRVHGALCQRLGAARRAAAALQRARAAERPARPPVAHALRLRPSNLPAAAAEPAHYYAVLLDLVRAVLDGNMDAPAYEDAAREMLGIKAYPAYTLDKLVSIAVRQLQHCVADPWSLRAAELARAGMRGPPAYVRRAARLLRHDHSAFLVKLYGGDSCRVTFELLAARAAPDDAAWRYRAAGAAGRGAALPVFLRRNARAAPGYTHNAHSQAAPQPAAAHARRKPADCGAARLLAFRPLQLYRRGCLAAARASQPRLAARRRDTFRAWLRDRAAP
ncbi:hypothetical protein HF086_002658 [Spodoptera exigua]|uniref:Histone deacetylase interacting domain-containing protein n=1 Tax=Spodoptera exigua TaxID=7107 RepID=A0A922MH26_SPOEX|nr:hypothetical protein HF086_002658 [Spodoptera exigua]